MTLVCDTTKKENSSIQGFESREQLLLSNMPIEGAETYKRMIIYATLKLVEAKPDISESNITYTLNRFMGYSPDVIRSVLTSLTSGHILPLLAWWKNPRLKRNKEKFFVLRNENSTIRNEYIQHLEANSPEFKALDFTEYKGLQ